MAEPKTFTKTITKDLDDNEAAKLGRELCQVLEEIDVANTYRKEFNAEMKEKLDGLAAKRRELKSAIEAGKVDTHLECYEEQDFQSSSVLTKRKDTGEVVDQRAMTAEERRMAMQMNLPITGDGGGPASQAQVISLTTHTHDDDGEYHEGCTACWASKPRPPVEPVDDATALAESVGPGNEIPPEETAPPSDEELDASVDANEADEEPGDFGDVVEEGADQ